MDERGKSESPRCVGTTQALFGLFGRAPDPYVPTFPKARYWMSAKDWDACHQPDLQPQRFPTRPAACGRWPSLAWWS